MTGVLTEIMALLTEGIEQMAQGVGGGLQALVNNLFLVTEGSTTTLSTFGSMTVIFAGISLAVGLCSLIFFWLTGLGKN